MVSKVNLKARIERHSRILKDNLWTIHPFRSMYHRLNYNIVLFIVIFLFPIYPLFSSFFYDSSVYDFYRWDIDESTIIDSYSNDEDSASLYWTDDFLSVNTLMDNKRDLEWYNEVINYEIQPWDSFSSIAYKFWVSNNSILWANNFTASKIIHPWEKIKIPPVSWLIHQVKKWDNIDAIAKKYSIDKTKILSQNWLNDWDILSEWISLIIPWAIKKVEVPKYVAKTTSTKKVPTKKKNTWANWAQWWYSYWWWDSEFVDDNWVYQLVKRTPQWTFYWWNCTRYVAQYKNVNWSWNAKDWLRNASAKWHSTWSEPWVWAIVVFYGSWYNPRYWHVWIVIDIKDDSIIVRDMNYRRLNEVTVRKVPKNDRAIRWYIYVD